MGLQRAQSAPVDYVRQATKVANPLAAAVSPFNGGVDVALAAGAANGCACGELRPSDVTSGGVVEGLQNNGEGNLAAIVSEHKMRMNDAVKHCREVRWSGRTCPYSLALGSW